MARLPHADLIVLDAAQVVTPPPAPRGPLRGEALRNLQVLPHQSVALSASKGTILVVAPWKELKGRVRISEETQVIRAAGKTVLPGFVDPHTHPVYAGTRANEFLLRAQGVSYMEVHRLGGGILRTVRETRAASTEALSAAAAVVLDRMLRHGTTTAEAKSGYGLTVEDEVRSLEIVNALTRKLAIDLVPTFMGAHAVPPEFEARRGAFVRLVVEEMIPRVAAGRLARFCDVFCEEGAFTVEESRTILGAAKERGLIPKLHAEEFAPTGGVDLAVEIGAASADHLLAIAPEGIAKLAASRTIAVLLPGTSFFLGTGRYAPARALLDAGAAVALGTDFNAGSSLTESMQMVLSLAVLKMKMTPEEAIAAATVNAAWAIGIGDRVGTIAPEQQGDLILLDLGSHREIPYHFGVNLVERVIKRGKVVV